MQYWEYKTIKIGTEGWLGGKLDTTKIDEELNHLGSQGWEAISAFSTTMGSGRTRDIVITLKRQKK